MTVSIMRFVNGKDYLDLPSRAFNLWTSQRAILKKFYMGTRGNEDLSFSLKEKRWFNTHSKDEVKGGVGYRKNIDGHKKGNFREMQLLLGRRSAKTVTENIIIAYEAYKFLESEESYGLPLGEDVSILITSYNMDCGYRMMKQVSSFIEGSSYFKGLIQKINQNSMTLKTKSGGALEIIIASPRSFHGAICGRNVIATVMDEVDYYDGESAECLYKCVIPAMSNFFRMGEGKLVMVSSPSPNGDGFLTNRFADSENIDEVFRVQLPTWSMNPQISHTSLRRFQQDTYGDFFLEYGAQMAKI